MGIFVEDLKKTLKTYTKISDRSEYVLLCNEETMKQVKTIEDQIPKNVKLKINNYVKDNKAILMPIYRLSKEYIYGEIK